MTVWIIIAILYVFNVGLFRWLGGTQSAGDALRRWGRSTSSVRQPHGSASS